MVVGRFAPSPTGRMHAGNIYAVLIAWLHAKSQGGSIVLRIEDLDAQRSRPEYIDALMRDFEYLGLPWDSGPFYQSSRADVYMDAFRMFEREGLVYPCFCTRAELLHAASAPHRGEKPIYPGTCRDLGGEELAQRFEERAPAWRLRVPSVNYEFIDEVQGLYAQELSVDCGDFLIRRADGAFAYQLAVVIDDAEQGVNSVVRGVDLLSSSPQQMFLQDLLGNKHPEYAHVPLLVADDNRRLSKRDHDANIEELMLRFGDARGIIGHLAYLAGIIDEDMPASPDELLSVFSIERFRENLPDMVQIPWR